MTSEVIKAGQKLEDKGVKPLKGQQSSACTTKFTDTDPAPIQLSLANSFYLKECNKVGEEVFLSGSCNSRICLCSIVSDAFNHGIKKWI